MPPQRKPTVLRSVTTSVTGAKMTIEEKVRMYKGTKKANLNLMQFGMMSKFKSKLKSKMQGKRNVKR